MRCPLQGTGCKGGVVKNGQTGSGHRSGLIVLLVLWLSACGSGGDGDSSSTSQRGDLVSASTVQSYTLLETGILSPLITEALGINAIDANYGIVIARLTYKTETPDGRLINASGVVAYPLKGASASSPMLSYQHATEFMDANAPGNNIDAEPMLLLGAARGYIVVMADYIGYGSSSSEFHTYVQSEGLANAIVDMVRAARTYLSQVNVASNGQLFLTGYSEGGYATMAAHKAMEEQFPAEFAVTASYPAGGPYNMRATADYMIGQETNPFPQYLAFVIKAYDHWYDWNRISTIYQSPYDAVVENSIDGVTGGGTIASQLTETTVDLFTAGFLASYPDMETVIATDLAANNIHDWAPSAPVRLYHGENDNVVPYVNATSAEAALGDNGATVTLVTCNLDVITGMERDTEPHGTCVPGYLDDMISWIGDQASDL